MIPADAGPVLLQIARAAIAEAVGAEASPAAAPRETPGMSAWLSQDGAAFVTLTQGAALRGCIGTLESYRPLRDDVRGNAVSAATKDPRFDPLTARELPDTTIEVSVLSTPELLDVSSRTEAVAALRSGIDGAILAAGSSRGTFLPQVWEKIPDPEDFLDHLIRKARLSGGWPRGAQLWRYTVTPFEESRP